MDFFRRYIWISLFNYSEQSKNFIVSVMYFRNDFQIYIIFSVKPKIKLKTITENRLGKKGCEIMDLSCYGNSYHWMRFY